MNKKKQIICPRCKKPVPAKTVFCESCGARVAHPPSCSLCGTLLAPDSRFCSSCGTPVPANPERTEDSVNPSPERSGVAVPPRKDGAEAKVPECAADSSEQRLPAIPENSIQVPAISKPTGNRKAGRVKRSAVTIVSEPDAQISTVFSRIPVAGIASHKYLVLILIAVVVIASMAAFGILRLPAPDSSSGAGANLSAEGAQSTLESSVVPGPEQVVTTDTIVPPVINLTPGPTQVPPDNLLVYFQAERDPITKIVSVLFMGGKGQAGVRDVFVRLTRSDGQVLTGSFKPIQVGSGVELPGTEKVDRVEVIVHYYTGDTYTVIDRTFAWKKQL
jgi:hypothetical protein